MEGLTICGTAIHAPELGKLDILENVLFEINGDGNIAGVYTGDSDEYKNKRTTAKDSGSLIELTDTQILLPGMIDLHIHAPQWPQIGKALHLPLYDWLQNFTFPLEAKYSDPEFAKSVYSSLVDTLIANGTTTALYFATIHPESTRLLAEICVAKGQRALVGKVAMDNTDECPDFYRDKSTQLGLEQTRETIENIRGLKGNEQNMVLPVVTPRFIPSCTDEMLSGLSDIANDYTCHIQTHCSESDWQHAYVIDRHGKNDTQSLHDFGLLTDRTILAHANFISDEDMKTIKSQNSGIAHCPLSNFYFSNAVFPARKILDHGINVGLGTDISGGPSPSLLHNCSVAVTSSRILEEGVNPDTSADVRGRENSRINFREAFWMATTGGGQALGMNIGKFEKDYVFDAILIDTSVPDSNLVIWDDDQEEILQKIIYNADRNNIVNVWVQGKQVK